MDLGTTLNLGSFVVDRLALTTNQSSLTQVDIQIDMAGAYTVTIDWGDGNTSAVSGTGSTYSHNYSQTGTYTIQVYGRIDQMTRFYVSAGYSTISGNIATFRPCNALTFLRLGSTSVSGDIANLPSGLTGTLYLYYTSVSGDIANLPSGLTGNLALYNTSVSGDIADLPSGLTGNLHLHNTSVSAYTAASWPCDTANDKTIDLDDLGLTQGECDNILCHLDTKGITGGTLDLTGNSVPSATGLDCKTNLEGKGWTVSVDS